VDIIAAGRPLIDLAKACYAADVPLLVVGVNGVGKSEMLQQAAAELGIGCRVYDLSVMEPVDLVGLPRERDGRTAFSPPDSLPTQGKGFLVFEELNRCPRYMQAPCLQLLTARRINDYVLPPGWLPAAAVNPVEEGGYEVVELDPALLSRFVCVAVRPDRGE
jgi:MoxR-like ATPase